MPTFEPPVVNDNPPVPARVDQRSRGHRLMRFYGGRPRGRTVLKNGDGSYSTVDTPTSDQVAAALEVYLGGHRYIVNEAQASALRAAGYTVPATRVFGIGTFGSGTFGGG